MCYRYPPRGWVAAVKPNYNSGMVEISSMSTPLEVVGPERYFCPFPHEIRLRPFVLGGNVEVSHLVEMCTQQISMLVFYRGSSRYSRVEERELLSRNAIVCLLGWVWYVVNVGVREWCLGTLIRRGLFQAIWPSSSTEDAIFLF